MIDNKRLAEILLPYGTVQAGHSPLGEWPVRRSGQWQIPLDEQSVLLVPEASLPPTVGDLLELLVDKQGGEREHVQRWLAGTDDLDASTLASLLEKMGWPTSVGAHVIAIERDSGTHEQGELVDAVEMLRELVSVEECVIATDGKNRIYLLVPNHLRNHRHVQAATESQSSPEREEGVFSEELSGWLDTLGAELFSLFRAGFSAPVSNGTSLPDARRQATFALEAGRLYQSKERVHDFRRLGLSRLFHGLSAEIQAQFLQEVMPDEVFTMLSPELRETVFAFLEHGQQAAETARSLYIHRNTLQYRLDRIAELTGFDVRKPLQAWTLWVALTLRRAT
ncbi:helix-turn-helix domain-containing protein [Tumebacillus sp. ITR2]|uniref:Helix-turn-helix domain-containing protein n=1 Tax=Tumebacillus amylolyticus TaxID=2801339 RepID=A0ABS1J6Y6_9BACL|nr:helix-turn-helix domain-containing protein [Tumebacillus amylolyticus]MBL0386033.1 helix-turn-helix domain-containing protein [Tumebacillus amylolyticus]